MSTQKCVMERGLIINVDHPFESVKLKEKVAFRNPDEFYLKMSNSKLLMKGEPNNFVYRFRMWTETEPKGLSVQILVRSGQMVLQSEPERISMCAPVTFIYEVYNVNAKTQLLKLRTYSALNM
nr:hypothetical protein [Tanacetum cinerariifolium]